MKRAVISAVAVLILSAAIVTLIVTKPFGLSRAAIDRDFENSLVSLYSSMIEDREVAATVDGEPIYRSHIEFNVEYGNLIKGYSKSVIPKDDLTSSQYELLNKPPAGYEEFLKLEIQEVAVCHAAEKIGITGDYEKKLKEVKERFGTIISAADIPNAGDYFKNTSRILEKIMAMYDSEEDFYREMAKKENRYSITTEYDERYLEGLSGTKEAKKELLQKHKEDLVSKADVVIY